MNDNSLTPTAWTRLRAAVDPFTRKTFGLYAAYPLTSQEYIGTVKRADIDALADKGYEPERLSAAKRHPSSGRLHVASLRRVPSAHPSAAEGTALASYLSNQCQYHVHAFPTDADGFYDCFSHYELRPDLRPVAGETWSEAFDRMAAHYRPTWDRPYIDMNNWSYLRAVTDLTL